MLRRLRETAALAAAAVVCGRASAEPDSAFVEAHERLAARNDLQFDFAAPPPPPPEPADLEWLARLIELLAPLFRLLFWLGVAAIVALIAFFIFRELVLVRWSWRLNRRGDSDVEAQDYRPTAEYSRVLLSEVDRLAAEGRFADAVRHLLHRSIQDVEEKRAGGLPRALTSREIAVHPALSERARIPFVAMAQTVERGFFGGRPIGADDFAACRAAYARFALPEGAE
jgi:hypothetical protein